jgi:hypothetical protein
MKLYRSGYRLQKKISLQYMVGLSDNFVAKFAKNSQK